MDQTGAVMEAAGFSWVLQAVLSWFWNTMILEVGRMALAIELTILFFRMPRIAANRKTGRLAALCRTLSRNRAIYAATGVSVLLIDYLLLLGWIGSYPYGTEETPETLSESLTWDGLAPFFTWTAQLLRVGLATSFTLLWPRAYWHFKKHDSGLWADAARRFSRNGLSIVGLVLVVILVDTALLAPWIAPFHFTKQNFAVAWQEPSWRYPFGTDGLGRDLFSRVIYGAEISMIVGVLVQGIIFAIGVPLGAIAGYIGGKTDNAIMRFVDVMSAFPGLLFIILVMATLGPGLFNIFIAIGVTEWVGVCRLLRGQVLSLKEKEFVRAARSMGGSHRRIILTHVLPNSMTPLIVSLALGIPSAIFTEAGLSFIGIGISPPTPSWGQMVGENANYIRSYWHLATFPGIMIALTMLGFQLMGDGFRDALDPKMNE
ncbi:MAG: ABC transporter permease [candidate division Zixibacteria bacterium]|nr:ABC transporter permease [candidate division Zixibacteria bacterium]